MWLCRYHLAGCKGDSAPDYTGAPGSSSAAPCAWLHPQTSAETGCLLREAGASVCFGSHMGDMSPAEQQQQSTTNLECQPE